MTGLEPLLAAGGYTTGLLVLLYLVIYLLRALRADRDHYVAQLEKKQVAVDAEARAREETQQRLDVAREERRKAEDLADEMRREVAKLRAEVEWLRSEVARLAAGGSR